MVPSMIYDDGIVGSTSEERTNVRYEQDMIRYDMIEQQLLHTGTNNLSQFLSLLAVGVSQYIFFCA